MIFSPRNIIIGIIVLILALAIPVTIKLSQQQQTLKSKAATACEQAYDGQTLSGQGQSVIDSFKASFGDGAEAEWIRQHNTQLSSNPPKATDNQTLFDQSCPIIYSFYASFGSVAPQKWVDEHNAAAGATALSGSISLNPSSIQNGSNVSISVSANNVSWDVLFCNSGTNCAVTSAGWASLGTGTGNKSVSAPINSGPGTFTIALMDANHTSIVNSQTLTVTAPTSGGGGNVGVGTCPVNTSCCAQPLKQCTANGLDQSCPPSFQWCYKGSCVHQNYNPSTDSCPGVFPSEGSTCKYQVLSGSQDVTAGPITEEENYIFAITMTNQADTTWLQGNYKLHLSSLTVSNWIIGGQSLYPWGESQTQTTKGNSVSFRIPVKAPKQKPADPGFPFEFNAVMNNGTSDFGTECKPALQVQKTTGGPGASPPPGGLCPTGSSVQIPGDIDSQTGQRTRIWSCQSKDPAVVGCVYSGLPTEYSCTDSSKACVACGTGSSTRNTFSFGQCGICRNNPQTQAQDPNCQNTQATKNTGTCTTSHTITFTSSTGSNISERFTDRCIMDDNDNPVCVQATKPRDCIVCFGSNCETIRPQWCTDSTKPFCETTQPNRGLCVAQAGSGGGGTCPSTISSTQVRMRKSGTTNTWVKGGLTITVGESADVAGFHDNKGQTADIATDIININATGPSGDASSTFTLIKDPTTFAANHVATFTPTLPGVYTITADTNQTGDKCHGSADITVSGTASPTSSPSPPPSPAPVKNTLCYAFGEGDGGKTAVDAITTTDAATFCKTVVAGGKVDNILVFPYAADPDTTTFKGYMFKDQTPGIKTFFVKFIGLRNGVTVVSSTLQKSITFKPNAQITNVSCTTTSSGPGTQITMTGKFFGPQGNAAIKVANQEAVIDNWDDVNNKITAHIDQRLDGKNTVSATFDNGITVTPPQGCTVNNTTVGFKVIYQCRAAGTTTISNADVKVFEGILASTKNATTPSPLIQQKVNFDKDGLPTNLAAKLEKNKNYELITKAPGALAKRIDFNSGSGGTTTLNNGDPIILLQGDIAPVNAPDGVINAFDKSELIRQWSLITDVARTGDLNGDSRINSVDYACMRQNINAGDEKFGFITAPIIPAGT